jgi:hypothetical protein
MMVKSYIKKVIDNHEKEFGIDFDISIRDTIEDNINNGVYAFQVIYNGHYQVHEIKRLNHSLLKYNKLLWSYDNGVRYQWGDTETLVFDHSVIRNIKIEEIIK